jgi:hypothetical protein
METRKSAIMARWMFPKFQGSFCAKATQPIMPNYAGAVGHS